MTQEILPHFGHYIEFKYGDKVSIGYGSQGGYEIIEWSHDDPQKDIETLIADAESYKETYESTRYIPARVEEYPTWQEQADMQYWDAVNGTTIWQDAIAKVKADNPKP